MAKKDVKAAKTRKKVKKKRLPRDRSPFQATFNNTIVTITDQGGQHDLLGLLGFVGFKGSRKSTPFAAQLAAENAAKKAMDNGLRSVDGIRQGAGVGARSGDPRRFRPLAWRSG